MRSTAIPFSVVATMLLAMLSSASVPAASYQKSDGTIVDPILTIYSGVHWYNGNNLEPNANLNSANLNSATHGVPTCQATIGPSAWSTLDVLGRQDVITSDAQHITRQRVLPPLIHLTQPTHPSIPFRSPTAGCLSTPSDDPGQETR